MDPEGMKKGSWEEQKKKLGSNPDFHMEEKKDEVEVMIGQLGWDGAFEKVEADLDSNPDDPEFRRRAALIIKLDDDRKASLRNKLKH